MLSEIRQREAEKSRESGDCARKGASGRRLKKKDDTMEDRGRVRGGSLSNDAQKMALLEKRFGWDGEVGVPGAGSRHSSQSCSNTDGNGNGRQDAIPEDGEGHGGDKMGMIDLAGMDGSRDGEDLVMLGGCDDGDKSRTGSGQNGMMNGGDQPQQKTKRGDAVAEASVVVARDGLGGSMIRKKRRVNRAPVRHGKNNAGGNIVKSSANAKGGGKTASAGGGGKERVTPSLSPFLDGKEAGAEYSEKKAVTPSGGQNNTISRYFAAKGSQGGSGLSHKEECGPSSSSPLGMSSGRGGECTSVRNLRIESESLREENRHLQVELKQTQQACDELEHKISSLEKDVAEQKESVISKNGLVRDLITKLATESAKKHRSLALLKLQEMAPRLGTLSVRRKGIDVQEVWEDGDAIKDLKTRYDQLAYQKEQIENLRKLFKKRLPLPGQPIPLERMDDQLGACSDAGPLHPDDWVVQEEIFKVRLSAIRRDEDALKAESHRLETEKIAHIRELKRLRDEEASRFCNHPILVNRYLLLELLGKGGFSEVFKALDLQEMKEVAVKIHQLSTQWSESKKASYVKHSVREYHIHKQLHHPRIVGLLDIFEIDNNTFATVLEYCSGGDLDEYMKAHDALPEREARAIIAQILSALSYLNKRPRSFIHYDLKPANILFDALGQCKITDFGLSKVVEEGHTQGMELTSQGAGTYWYLPPECFDVKSIPLISNKVDVWSVGVILYQMLYGKRPFGHDQSQEQILRNEVMLNAREVQFPARPSISSECKAFLQESLAYRQDMRMDVHAAAAHPFLAMKKK